MNEILTPCILHNIIICSTIIILCVVAVSAFRIHKVEERKKELEMKDIENGSCLGSYIFLSSIVVLIAVVIFSYAFFANKEVLDFMSLASALVSIILAVVTIIYSFVVNGQTAGQIDKLTATSEDLKSAAEEARHTSTKVTEAANSFITATDSYSKSAASLEKNINIILDQLNQVRDAISSVDEYRIEDKDADNIQHKGNSIDEFCHNCPNAGLMMMYACIKAEKAKKSLSLRKMFDPEMTMYYVGFLSSMQSLGYIEAALDYDKMVLKKINVHKDIKDIIPKLIMKRKDNEFVKNLYEKIDRIFRITK